MPRNVTWTPAAGSVRHEVYFWGGYQWVRVAEGPTATFTITPPKGTYRWLVADVMPDGTRKYQRDFGFWTSVPYN